MSQFLKNELCNAHWYIVSGCLYFWIVLGKSAADVCYVKKLKSTVYVITCNQVKYRTCIKNIR